MNFDPDKHAIFKTLTGSRVYGTHTETSDYDYRGVIIPPKEYFFGYSSAFEQYEDKKNDTTLFEIRKFLKLASENNPNIIELLYIPEKYWVHSSRYWKTLVAQRELILSKKCFYTFTGYAYSQLKRIRTHRNWLLKGELVKPERTSYGLPIAAVPKEILNAAKELININLNRFPIEELLSTLPKDVGEEIRQTMWNFLETMTGLSRPQIEDNAFVHMGKFLGYEDNFLDYIHREKQYNKDLAEYNSWNNWKNERNEKRKELERVAGYDSKHASHLVRLIHMSREILTDHVVIVERPDAALLRDIRNGLLKFEQIEEYAHRQFSELEDLYKTSTLRHSPDRKTMEWVCMTVVEDFLRDSNGFTDS